MTNDNRALRDGRVAMPTPPWYEARDAALLLADFLLGHSDFELYDRAVWSWQLIGYALKHLPARPDGRLIPRGRKAPKVPRSDKALAHALASTFDDEEEPTGRLRPGLPPEALLVAALGLLTRFVQKAR